MGFAAGDGRLVRRKSTLLLTASAANDMVEAFDNADDDEAALNAVKKHLVDTSFASEPLVVVRWESTSVDLLVFGPIEVHSSVAAVPMISGSGSASWVERRLGSFELGSADTVAVWAGSESPPDIDLRAGIAAADGFHLTLRLSGPPSASAEPPTPPADVVVAVEDASGSASEHVVAVEPDVFSSDVAGGVADELAPRSFAPSPDMSRDVFATDVSDEIPGSALGEEADVMFGDDTDIGAVESGHVDHDQREPQRDAIPGLVEALHCANGHANRPGAAECRTCSESLAVDAPASLIAQPAVGVAVFTDGNRLIVDRNCMIGRKPVVHDNQSSVLVVDDPAVSREHAILGVDGWTAYLTDCGSRNGSYVIAPGTTTPVRLDENVQYVLDHGVIVHLGGPDVAFRFVMDDPSD